MVRECYICSKMFVDVKKAFDSGYHTIFLAKLEYIFNSFICTTYKQKIIALPLIISDHMIVNS